jgi:hypothetical protein
VVDRQETRQTRPRIGVSASRRLDRRPLTRSRGASTLRASRRRRSRGPGGPLGSAGSRAARSLVS